MRIESRARRYRLPRLPDWLRELLAEAPALPSQLLAVCVLLVMVATEAGYGDTNWPPAALLLLALLLVTSFVVPLPRRPGALQLAGLALFAGYAAWSFLSITSPSLFPPNTVARRNCLVRMTVPFSLL